MLCFAQSDIQVVLAVFLWHKCVTNIVREEAKKQDLVSSCMYMLNGLFVKFTVPCMHPIYTCIVIPSLSWAKHACSILSDCLYTNQGVIQDFEVGGNKVAREACPPAPPPPPKFLYSEVNSGGFWGCLFSFCIWNGGKILRCQNWVCATNIIVAQFKSISLHQH